MKAKTVSVHLGGRERALRFDIGAVEAYERATTFVLEDGTIVRGSAMDGLMPRSISEFVALVWACLHSAAEDAGDEPPTRREVARWLSEDDAMDRLYKDVVEVLGANSPEPRDPGQEGDDGPADPPMAEAG